MFPNSSIKRLRLAFVAMAGFTLLGLFAGCLTFAYHHTTQQRFLTEAAPLLINVEQLSKAAISYVITAESLETVESEGRLNRSLDRHRSDTEIMKARLVELADRELDQPTIDSLNGIVRKLDELDTPFAEALRSKIDAQQQLANLRSAIAEEGQFFFEQVDPLALEASLELINVAQQPDREAPPDIQALSETLHEVQLLTNIGFTAERFLNGIGRQDASALVGSTSALREKLAPDFRLLAQLVSKLTNQGKRQTLADSLALFNDKALEVGGMADQVQELGFALDALDNLGAQQARLLAEMNETVDRVVRNARERFFEAAGDTRRSSLLAIATLAILSVIAFGAAVWIGWRLINRDIALRLQHLATSTAALADGDLDVGIDQSGTDELASMARAVEVFRQNAQELRRTEEELAERLVEVEQGNSKLAAANTALDGKNAELAASELRYELAVAGSSVGIWDWDAQTNALFWSDRLKEMVGVTDQTFVPDQSSFESRLHPNDRQSVLDMRRRHLEDGQEYDIECRLRCEDGEYVWIRNRGAAIWDDDGAPIRMAGSADDISDRKAAELKLASYARELERSNRELDEFAFIAAHDLKEPLRAIYNHASFLLEDYQETIGDDGKQRLDRLVSLSQRMEKLIADLLYFSRLGRGEKAREQLDVKALIGEVEVNLKDMLQSSNARMSFATDFPPVIGSRTQIIALFQNLIVNGIKYNNAEEKIVEIGLSPAIDHDDVGDVDVFYVKDNGIGIEEQFNDEIFRIFKRLNSEKAYGGGTGAGLSFVKKIVENHGGRIWLHSKLGQGTTFFFTLQEAG